MNASASISLALLLVVTPVSPLLPRLSQVEAEGGSTAPCASVSPVTTGNSGIEAEGTATGGGQFLALLAPQSATFTEDPLKIVFAMTGAGPLHISAIGPEGQVVLPSQLESHLGGSSWSHPGDEWGSMWLFQMAGCWHLHAVRDTIAADLWFNVTALHLHLTSFAIRQGGRDRTTIKSGVRAIFLLGTVTNAPGVSAWITVSRMGKDYRVLAPIGSANASAVGALILRQSIMFHQKRAASFSATAHVQVGNVTLSRRLQFRVSP